MHIPASDDYLRRCIGKIATGDEKTFEHFCAVTRMRLFGHLLQVTQDIKSAEEVVFEVYLYVWHRAHTFRSAIGSPIEWLLTLCSSLAFDRLTNRRRAGVVGDSRSMAPASAGGPAGADDLLDTAGERGRARVALARLDPMDRQLLMLALHEGMTHGEITLHMGLDQAAVTSGIRRGLIMLRHELERLASGAPPPGGNESPASQGLG